LFLIDGAMGLEAIRNVQPDFDWATGSGLHAGAARTTP
jgi:hypothetical protein